VYCRELSVVILRALYSYYIYTPSSHLMDSGQWTVTWYLAHIKQLRVEFSMAFWCGLCAGILLKETQCILQQIGRYKDKNIMIDG